MSTIEDRDLLRRRIIATVNHAFSTSHPDDPIGFITLPLARMLIELGQDWIDELVGDEFLRKNEAGSANAVRRGGQVKAETAAVYVKGTGQVSEDALQRCRVGASALIGQLAIGSQDAYLRLLAQGLQNITVGQPNSFLEPATNAAHPKEHAGEVLILRSTPFCIVEFLTAADPKKYPDKTTTAGRVAELLEMKGSSLDYWRRQQNKKRRSMFKAELIAWRRMGERVRATLDNPNSDESTRAEANRQLGDFGLPAVKKFKQRLDALGASRGRRHSVDK